jgi:hypothetical protein
MRYHEYTTYDRPNPALAYQWKRKLVKRDIKLIEHRLGSLLAARNYPPSGYSPVRPSAYQRRLFAFQNRWGRAMNRRRRYGFWMWMASILAPRLPYRKWRRMVRLRLNEIERRQLK